MGTTQWQGRDGTGLMGGVSGMKVIGWDGWEGHLERMDWDWMGGMRWDWVVWVGLDGHQVRFCSKCEKGCSGN